MVSVIRFAPNGVMSESFKVPLLLWKAGGGGGASSKCSIDRAERTGIDYMSSCENLA